jgi:hypothetical protein
MRAPSLTFFETFPYFGPTFSGPQKRRKNTSSQNAHKSQKSGVQVIFGPILVAFSNHFGVLLPEKINAKTGNGKDQENHQKSCFSEE